MPSRLTSCIARKIARHFAAPLENRQKSFAHMLVVQKIAVHERKLVADELRQIGMQLSAAVAARGEKRA